MIKEFEYRVHKDTGDKLVEDTVYTGLIEFIRHEHVDDIQILELRANGKHMGYSGLYTKPTVTKKQTEIENIKTIILQQAEAGLLKLYELGERKEVKEVKESKEVKEPSRMDKIKRFLRIDK